MTASIEIAAWPTVVEADAIVIMALSLRHDTLSVELSGSDGRRWRTVAENVQGFRALDEAGLVEIWEARERAGASRASTFRVRGHG